MADGTQIEWTEATWNPITGCSVTSPGCTNCYAMKLAGTRLKHSPSRKGLTQPSKAGPVWTGEVRFNEHELTHPLRWKRPRLIFVCAHGDLFHESVPDAWIDRVFAIMALCPQHTFQVLTKRSGRMREYLRHRWQDTLPQKLTDAAFYRVHGLAEGIDLHRYQASHIGGCNWWPLPNVWLGVSVEDQQRADERIPDLLATPAAVRWISAEPLLGPVDLSLELQRLCHECDEPIACCTSIRHEKNGARCCERCEHNFGLDWVVAGGESGPGARPMHPDWARSLRDQCAAADVPFFFKQWGNHLPFGQWHAGSRPGNYATPVKWGTGPEFAVKVGKRRAGRLLDGELHDGMPGKQ